MKRSAAGVGGDRPRASGNVVGYGCFGGGLGDCLRGGGFAGFYSVCSRRIRQRRGGPCRAVPQRSRNGCPRSYPRPALQRGRWQGVTTNLAGVDPATRFYILWRYTYRAAELEAGEAIIFANGTHVELDGADGLSRGRTGSRGEEEKANTACSISRNAATTIDLGKPPRTVSPPH